MSFGHVRFNVHLHLTIAPTAHGAAKWAPTKYSRENPTPAPVQAAQEGVHQEAKNRPNIDWQDKIHRGISRGLRNISETP